MQELPITAVPLLNILWTICSSYCFVREGTTPISWKPETTISSCLNAELIEGLNSILLHWKYLKVIMWFHLLCWSNLLSLAPVFKKPHFYLSTTLTRLWVNLEAICWKYIEHNALIWNSKRIDCCILPYAEVFYLCNDFIHMYLNMHFSL